MCYCYLLLLLFCDFLVHTHTGTYSLLTHHLITHPTQHTQTKNNNKSTRKHPNNHTHHTQHIQKNKKHTTKKKKLKTQNNHSHHTCRQHTNVHTTSVTYSKQTKQKRFPNHNLTFIHTYYITLHMNVCPTHNPHTVSYSSHPSPPAYSQTDATTD